MKRAASVFALLALLSVASLTACGDGDDGSTGSSSAAEGSSFKDSCTISTALLGFVVARVTKGKSLEEIGEAVSSKFGGDVLSAACETAVNTFIDQPEAKVGLTVEEVNELIPTRVSLDELLETIRNPPPEPPSVSDLIACFDYEGELAENLCLKGLIPPP